MDSENFSFVGIPNCTGENANFQATPAARAKYASQRKRAKLAAFRRIEDETVADKKAEETFRVIDRRPFTTDGELREEFVADQEREVQREAKKEASAAPTTAAAAPQAGDALPAPVAPPVDAPKRSAAFENLIRMLGSNAAMVLGAYTDPRTGQPVIDPDAARELIDMLDALYEKTKGHLAPEEDDLLLDLSGKLKMTYLEINQAIAAQAAAEATKAKAR